MSFCNHFNFGTYKHTGIIYSSNHSIAKLTLNMRRNFWQPKTSPAPCPIAAILGLNAGWQTDFIARTPGCVRNDSETHETVLLDCTTGERNWDGACLMNLTQQIFFFKLTIWSIALMNLGETCHLKGRDMVTLYRTLLLLCWNDYSALWHHTVWTRGVTINRKIVSRVQTIRVSYRRCLNQYKWYLLYRQKSHWKSHRNWLWV